MDLKVKILFDYCYNTKQIHSLYFIIAKSGLIVVRTSGVPSSNAFKTSRIPLTLVAVGRLSRDISGPGSSPTVAL
jgi:hypothetical protein